MTMTAFHKRINMTISAVLLLSGSIAISRADDIAQVELSRDALVLYPTDYSYAGYTLTIAGPDGFYFREEFGAAFTPLFQMSKGEALTDGLYKYELVPSPASRKRPRFDDAPFIDSEGGNQTLSGTFRVINGSILIAALENIGDDDSDEPGLAKDQSILDDLIVDGSACVGTDCVSGESFGFDTLRLKENNLRIKFDDTSNSASFPFNDWQLTANDSTNGGANKFSIDDITNSRTPFTIEASAPSHSLYVDDGGRIGLGTSTPVVELHVVNGDSPALRLEQNGSSGFTPQTWDVAGNETNFFVRDATNGSQLPFKIRPGADTNSLVIDSDNNIGLGVLNATSSLHIKRGNAAVAVEDTDTSAGEKFMMLLSNAGTGKTRMQLGNSGATWSFDVESGASDFLNISKFGTGVNEFRLQGNGDGFFLGDVYSKGVKLTSSRQLKTNVEPVNTTGILDKLAKLDVSSWQFTHDREQQRHIGPMAEDFQALFGGSDERHIDMTDANGVLFAAVKGLYQIVKDKHREIEILEQKNRLLETENTSQQQINTNLENRISRLEKLLIDQSVAPDH